MICFSMSFYTFLGTTSSKCIEAAFFCHCSGGSPNPPLVQHYLHGLPPWKPNGWQSPGKVTWLWSIQRKAVWQSWETRWIEYLALWYYVTRFWSPSALLPKYASQWPNQIFKKQILSLRSTRARSSAGGTYQFQLQHARQTLDLTNKLYVFLMSSYLSSMSKTKHRFMFEASRYHLNLSIHVFWILAHHRSASSFDFKSEKFGPQSSDPFAACHNRLRHDVNFIPTWIFLLSQNQVTIGSIIVDLRLFHCIIRHHHWQTAPNGQRAGCSKSRRTWSNIWNWYCTPDSEFLKIVKMLFFRRQQSQSFPIAWMYEIKIY